MSHESSMIYGTRGQCNLEAWFKLQEFINADSFRKPKSSVNDLFTHAHASDGRTLQQTCFFMARFCSSVRFYVSTLIQLEGLC